MTCRRVVVPLIAVLLAAGCTSSEPQKAAVAVVTRTTVSEVVEAPATVGARATATLTAPASGTIARLYVQDGDTVKKGQILARISSPQARQQLSAAREADRQAAKPVSFGGGAPVSVRLPSLRLPSSLDTHVARSFAQARKAARSIGDRTARARLLAAIDTAEKRQRAQRRALGEVLDGLTRAIGQSLSQVSGQMSAGISGLSASMASLRAASRSQTKAAVRAAEQTVDALAVRAPFGGVVTLGGASSASGGAGLGALVSQLPAGLTGQAGAAAAAPAGRSGGTIATGVPVAAGDPIVTVTDVSVLTLSADVDETDVLLVHKGTPADVEFDAVTGATYTATVTGVGVIPKEGATGGVGYPVRLRLGRGAYDDGGAAPAPKPGMSAVVRLAVRRSENVTAVPASAIVTSGRESIVWVVRDGRAERRVVRLGAQGDAVVEILSGVSPGERVVVKGADAVRPGQSLS
ncbi:efflux RND transporter periplasmic adaptor subunit [Microbispora hainanensis]|uniref:HlyD family efflux transporter periplasmic adaptor subunit n=1 Tax=Microbispora hainanensis TaxID=568844 RepID=A0A544Z5Z5_9ACTN|nr:HlyD family efflux transporter periplasmic adaptor subunit [Microbispora hainanensis]TQS24331.1 HlyD family efflux transporter periplasmic adaptor subunit [Microbispora hainanensis]